MGELSDKGRRGQRNREEIGAGVIFLAASPLVLARFAREFFVDTPPLRPARQNRHATQANLRPDLGPSTPTESRHTTCLLGGKRPSVKLMSRRENKILANTNL